MGSELKGPIIVFSIIQSQTYTSPIIFYPTNNNEPLNNNNDNNALPAPSQNQDQFPNAQAVHWNHMLLSYNFYNESNISHIRS